MYTTPVGDWTGVLPTLIHQQLARNKYGRGIKALPIIHMRFKYHLLLISNSTLMFKLFTHNFKLMSVMFCSKTLLHVHENLSLSEKSLCC